MGKEAVCCTTTTSPPGITVLYVRTSGPLLQGGMRWRRDPPLLKRVSSECFACREREHQAGWGVPDLFPPSCVPSPFPSQPRIPKTRKRGKHLILLLRFLPPPLFPPLSPPRGLLQLPKDGKRKCFQKNGCFLPLAPQWKKKTEEGKKKGVCSLPFLHSRPQHYTYLTLHYSYSFIIAVTAYYNFSIIAFFKLEKII